MKHIADALNVLQGEKKIGLGFLLPTISELKGKLQKLQDDPTITHCQPLITRLLDAIHFSAGPVIEPPSYGTGSVIEPIFLCRVSAPPLAVL
ncbi:hypothetical protein OUZ56_012469 [Daphnia magna]|uniref:Uncharacterized protein n=1 Tax=Daphnia magna TaxID=35525 RepID=A0ABQ9Z330_9CRUS|nr:hypothetical protein OUZ56_012469 [Daphnia magna]